MAIQKSLVSLVAAVVLSVPTHAQGAQAPAAARAAVPADPIVLECPDGFSPVGPDVCTGPYVLNEGQQSRILRVRVVKAGNPGTGVADVAVRFRATSGSILRDSTTTDDHGYASTLWYRPSGRDTATVLVEARKQGEAALRVVRVGPPAPALRLGVERWRLSPGWFEKNTLPQPPVVHIYRVKTDGTTEALVDSAVCAAQRVAFTRVPGSGSISPDTATAAVNTIDTSVVRNLRPEHSAVRVLSAHNPDPGTQTPQQQRGCFAVASWTLGDGAGERALRATLIPGPTATASGGQSTEFHTVARALPRLVGGVVVAQRRGYLGLAREDRVVHIERQLPDESTMSFDTTLKGTGTVDTVSTRFEPYTFVGVSSAVVPQWRWLSATVGVDLKNPTTEWFAGVSLLRVARRLSTENLPIDLHVLVHAGRSPVLREPATCGKGGSCKTRDTIRFHGFGGMLSVDASSLFSELIKKIAS